MSDLERWLKTLEQEKGKRVEEVENLPVDEDIKRIAINQIERDYLSARIHLKSISERGFRVNDNLSADEGLLSESDDYCDFYHHLSRHYENIKRVPSLTREGRRTLITSLSFL